MVAARSLGETGIVTGNCICFSSLRLCGTCLCPRDLFCSVCLVAFGSRLDLWHPCGWNSGGCAGSGIRLIADGYWKFFSCVYIGLREAWFAGPGGRSSGLCLAFHLAATLHGLFSDWELALPIVQFCSLLFRFAFCGKA